MIDALQDLILPLFLTLGVLLRILGAAGFGLVAGAVIRNAIERDEKTTKYLIPLVLFIVGLILVAMGWARWALLFGGLEISTPGSPGTLGAFGLGVALSYFLLGRKKEE